MPNTSYSEAMKEAATMADTDVVIIDTLEISHPDIESIYLANDRAALTAATGPGDGLLSLPGVAGNYASVAAADVTLPTTFMDARIIFGEAYRANPNFDGDVIPFSHYSTASEAWYIKVNSWGGIQFPTWSTADVLGNFNTLTAIPTTADGVRVVFRGVDDLDPSQASAQFFYTLDGGATWVEHTNRAYASSATTYSLKQGTAAISLGERDEGTIVPLHGTIEKAEIYGAEDEADLRLRVDFSDKAAGSPSFTNEEGIPVTLTSSAEFSVGGAGATYVGGASLAGSGTGSYLSVDGVTGSYASHPYNVDMIGLGDFTYQVDDVTTADWTANTQTLFGQFDFAYPNPAEANFYIQTLYTGVLTIQMYNSATNSTLPYSSTVGHGVANGGTASFRIERVGSIMRFYVDTGSGFTKLGADVTAFSTVSPSFTQPIKVGAYNATGLLPLNGQIGRVRMWSDATQTTNVFDLNFAGEAIAGGIGVVTRTDSVTYEPVGFKFKLPSVTGNGVQDMSLEFSNVDRRVNDFIESVEASIDPVVVVHRVYLSGGDLNSQSENSPPLRLTLSDIEISAFSVRARASFLNIVNKHFPTSYYDRDRFPSI